MLIQLVQRWASRLAPLKTPAIIVISTALGAGLAIYVPTFFRPEESPAKPSAVDKRFVPIGKAYLPELGRVYADAWIEGATLLENGQSIASALNSVSKSWNEGRVGLFDRMVTPEFSKVVPEGEDEAESNADERIALARAWRGFALGLDPSRK
jgi:hypothetical protein